LLRSLRLINFKSFADASLRVGGLTVIVGANASGKSNIRDALRFLHGIGRGYSLAEIIGGKYGEAGYREWAPLRGAGTEIIRYGQTVCTIEIEICTDEGEQLKYEISIAREKSRGTFRLEAEKLSSIADSWRAPFFESIEGAEEEDEVQVRMRASEGARGPGRRITLRRDKPLLGQMQSRKGISSSIRGTITDAMHILADIRFLDLVADSIRQPSFPGLYVLGESGENLPSVLQTICDDENRKRMLLSWVSELTPLDVKDFEFNLDATGRVVMYFVDATGKSTSALSASDGTLRFLAMAVALMDDQGPSLLFFEEIDNGLHPSRMRLLAELIEQRVLVGNVQVITTTHSPDLLSILGEDAFLNTAVVYRSPYVDSSIIRQIADLPHAKDLRINQSLGKLHAGGWFEDAIYLTDPAEADE